MNKKAKTKTTKKKSKKVQRCWCGSTCLTKETHILGQRINPLCEAHYNEALWEAVLDRG